MSEILANGMIVILIFLILYSYFGLVIEKYKPPCGHEAAIVIILGMIVSFLVYEQDTNKLS